jgi:hypothetical protein
MITKSTVLILGAGASKPFGYPTGKELKKTICDNLGQWEDGFFRSAVNLDAVRDFKEHLTKSPDVSVDAFLEYRPEFLTIGKLAIASALIPLENESALFDDQYDKNNWYEYLFNEMSCRFEEFENNKLSIVTFNYDRSLEHYFINGLQAKYGKNINECAIKLKTIPIIHLHGQLGNLPWQPVDVKKKSRAYGINRGYFDLFEASQQIKIVSENIGTDPEFIKAQELITKAEVVYFLGFGYNENNMQRLNIDREKPEKVILGSSYGLGSAEIKKIETKWNVLKLTDHQYEVLGFLRNCGPLI